MGDFRARSTDASMRVTRKHLLIGMPEVAVGSTRLVRLGNPLPQSATAFLSPIPYKISDDVSRAAALCNPYPPSVGLRYNDHVALKSHRTYSRDSSISGLAHFA